MLAFGSGCVLLSAAGSDCRQGCLKLAFGVGGCPAGSSHLVFKVITTATERVAAGLGSSSPLAIVRELLSAGSEFGLELSLVVAELIELRRCLVLLLLCVTQHRVCLGNCGSDLL